MVIVTTDSDAYVDVICFDMDGNVIDPTNLNIRVDLKVKDEVFSVEYMPSGVNENIECVQSEYDGIYCNALRITITKNTFSEGGVLKISTCEVTPDNNFKEDNNKEEWTRYESTNIKYIER